MHLPNILEQGISKGEVPLYPGCTLSHPNLTSSANPSAQHWCAGNGLDKTKVRLTVRVEEKNPALKGWRQLVLERNVNRRWARKLDPYGQGKFWHIYFGVIRPEDITQVCLLNGGEYTPVAGDGLDALLASIKKEKEKVETVPNQPDFLRLKPGFESSWLLDGLAGS
jgi:hypothetical protein